MSGTNEDCEASFGSAVLVLLMRRCSAFLPVESH